VPGRLERVENPRGVHAFVDYAHKPGALEVVLQTLRALKGSGRLSVVFGCGGDRDRAKRPAMGKIAAQLADEVWLTSDNPRTEDPMQILGEIRAGIPASKSARVVPDRREAIFQAVRAAAPGDILVIAGRGHETHQLIGVPGQPGKSQKVPFDDRTVLAMAFAESGSSP
jgi:UDP-N-acetylmuramoyl-L-alanyl-D-glutamate--2,6-diaminopimelate ligase